MTVLQIQRRLVASSRNWNLFYLFNNSIVSTKYKWTMSFKKIFLGDKSMHSYWAMCTISVKHVTHFTYGIVVNGTGGRIMPLSRASDWQFPSSVCVVNCSKVWLMSLFSIRAMNGCRKWIINAVCLQQYKTTVSIPRIVFKTLGTISSGLRM